VSFLGPTAGAPRRPQIREKRRMRERRNALHPQFTHWAAWVASPECTVEAIQQAAGKRVTTCALRAEWLSWARRGTGLRGRCGFNRAGPPAPPSCARTQRQQVAPTGECSADVLLSESARRRGAPMPLLRSAVPSLGDGPHLRALLCVWQLWRTVIEEGFDLGSSLSRAPNCPCPQSGHLSTY
jgi:hypothetical protein